MGPWTWVVIAGAVVVVLLAVLAIRVRGRLRDKAKTTELRERFGPEYDRTVDQRGRTEAESELESRVDRYQRSPARPLSAEDRQRFMQRWAELQASYVDDPKVAVQRADGLLRNIADLREIPADRLDDRVTAAAFIRTGLADEYRRAHGVYVDIEAERSGPDAEHDQRHTFLVYREFVLGLIEPDDDHDHDDQDDHDDPDPDRVVVADPAIGTGEPVR